MSSAVSTHVPEALGYIVLCLLSGVVETRPGHHGPISRSRLCISYTSLFDDNPRTGCLLNMSHLVFSGDKQCDAPRANTAQAARAASATVVKKISSLHFTWWGEGESSWRYVPLRRLREPTRAPVIQ